MNQSQDSGELRRIVEHECRRFQDNCIHWLMRPWAGRGMYLGGLLSTPIHRRRWAALGPRLLSALKERAKDVGWSAERQRRVEVQTAILLAAADAGSLDLGILRWEREVKRKVSRYVTEGLLGEDSRRRQRRWRRPKTPGGPPELLPPLEEPLMPGQDHRHDAGSDSASIPDDPLGRLRRERKDARPKLTRRQNEIVDALLEQARDLFPDPEARPDRERAARSLGISRAILDLHLCALKKRLGRR
jgi:hypothetical protein